MCISISQGSGRKQRAYTHGNFRDLLMQGLFTEGEKYREKIEEINTLIRSIRKLLTHTRPEE